MRTRDEQKEQTIRRQAVEMVVREGFDGLSMHKLGKAAGISPATIYIYFKDRDDLILQLCRELSAKMAEATLKDFDPDMHFDEGLKRQWLNRARYCMENPAEMHFLEQIRFSPFHEKCQAIMDTSFREAMRRFVRNAIERNELVNLPVEVYWSVAFAPLYQLVKFHMSGKGVSGNTPFELNEEMMEQTLRLVLRALKP